MRTPGRAVLEVRWEEDWVLFPSCTDGTLGESRLYDAVTGVKPLNVREQQ